MKLFQRLPIVAGIALSMLALVASPAFAKPDAKQAKINVLVDVLNAWSGYVYDNSSSYTKVVDPTKGPTCKESNLRGPSAIGDTALKTTFPAYKKALAKAPKLAIDAAAMKMVDTLIALSAPTNEASEYYYKRKFKDDDCKRGQELHVQLLPLWQDFITAERDVRAFIVTYNDELQVKSLAATKKKYGEKLRYHYEKSLADGKLLIREIDAQLAAETPDGAAISARLDAFAATIEMTQTLSEKERPNRKIYDVLYQGGYTQFVSRGINFRDSSKRLVETLAKPDKKPKQQASELERAQKQTLVDYNGMVDAANKVQLSAKIK